MTGIDNNTSMTNARHLCLRGNIDQRLYLTVIVVQQWIYTNQSGSHYIVFIPGPYTYANGQTSHQHRIETTSNVETPHPLQR